MGIKRLVEGSPLSAVNRPVSIAPLITFRILFGLLMFVSLCRFWWRGWIDRVYIQPEFHFTYWGFEWVTPFPGIGMYILFVIVLLAALLITVGLYYRVAAVVFFLGFTYMELIDVTTYLNHYYFISLVAFIMIWLPANRHYAADVYRKPAMAQTQVPAWTIGILQFQLAVVYVFAGLAKLNADWLLQAEPMKTWLPGKSHLPIVGPYMYKEWVAYLFSWFGAVYDCLIVFFLLNRRTRLLAYLAVLVFHIATAIFFPGIGLFPYVMIVATLIFFSGKFHEKLLGYLPFYPKQDGASIRSAAAMATAEPVIPGPDGTGTPHDVKTTIPAYPYAHSRTVVVLLAGYIVLQLIIPLRFLCYPDHLFWSEEGYRFSWRVMLMEKSGAAYFTVKDSSHARYTAVNNAAFLTPLQEKMMSTQPDMILKYAHYLRDQYAAKGWQKPEVYGEIYVALNGQRSRLFIDSTVNLAAQPLSWSHYNWIVPYNRQP